MIRTVVGTINRITGEPWTNLEVRFNLSPGSYALAREAISEPASYPAQFVIVKTDQSGKFTAELWANEEGRTASTYSCQVQGESFDFSIPTADLGSPDSIDLTELRARGVEPFASPVPPKLVKRQLFAPVSGQTIFSLSTVAKYPHLSRLWVNGVKYVFGIDYLINGLSLVWLSSIRLESTDYLEILY